MAASWPWSPTRILREVRSLPTRSGATVVETDLGEGYLKALGNDSGPHSLACELIGTMLAQWLNLSTLDYGIIEVTAEFQPNIGNGRLAETGPAFITRSEVGDPWSGLAKDLNTLTNPEDVARLVVFDTWTQNCDRHQPREGRSARENLGNVFLSRDSAGAGQFTLKAIDQGCCFTCDNELSIRNLSTTTDDQIYGYFPGFRSHARRETALRTVDQLESITREEIAGFISRVPPEWDVSPTVRERWREWINDRARAVRRIIEQNMHPVDLLDDISDRERQP